MVKTSAMTNASAEQGNFRPQGRTSLASAASFVTAVALLVLVPAVLWPVNCLPVRIAVLASATLLWAGIMYLGRKSKILFRILAAITVVTGVLVVSPGRGKNTAALREAYVHALASFEGTQYWWGGENRIGIDCSGLVRRAMIWALAKRGTLTFNGGLVRAAAGMWWRDTSAKALRDEYRGLTNTLTSVESINVIDHSVLLPGDMAVTADGGNILAYLGGNLWIEADPGDGKVIKVAAPSHDNGWFRCPVRIIRWKCLAE